MKMDDDQSPERLEAFLAAVAPAKRQRDARVLIDMFGHVTGLEPKLWGTIIGFGTRPYSTKSGPAGDLPLAAFAPRRAASTIYLQPQLLEDTEALDAIGPHTASKGCLYLKDLEQVDLAALERLLVRSYRDVSGPAVG